MIVRFTELDVTGQPVFRTDRSGAKTQSVRDIVDEGRPTVKAEWEEYKRQYRQTAQTLGFRMADIEFFDRLPEEGGRLLAFTKYDRSRAARVEQLFSRFALAS
jgi:hypothetical protein